MVTSTSMPWLISQGPVDAASKIPVNCDALRTETAAVRCVEVKWRAGSLVIAFRTSGEPIDMTNCPLMAQT